MMLGWLCRAWPPVFSEQGLMLMMRGLLCWEKSVGPGVFASGADAHDAGLVVSEWLLVSFFGSADVFCMLDVHRDIQNKDDGLTKR